MRPKTYQWLSHSILHSDWLPQPISRPDWSTRHHATWGWRLITLHLTGTHASETITCYTDGSRTDSGSGAGYIITTNNNNTTLEERSFKLPDYCTDYQTKLTAIIEACKYLSTYTNTHIIIIWSDSLSSIQAISSLSTRSRTTRVYYDCLNALGSTNNLEIRWIAAHIRL